MKSFPGTLLSAGLGNFTAKKYLGRYSKKLSLCVQKGMLSGKRQAIDSAYIKANASMDSLVEKEIIEDGDHYLDELQHDEYGKKIEQHDNVRKMIGTTIPSAKAGRKALTNITTGREQNIKTCRGANL